MTNITRYDPFRNLFAWPRWMEEFEETSQQKGLKVHETDKDIVVEAVVAGVPAKDVEVTIEDGVLTLKAEKTEEKTTKDEYKASSYQYYYTVALSGGQWDKTQAHTKDGIVKVVIPKAESAKRQKIQVIAKDK